MSSLYKKYKYKMIKFFMILSLTGILITGLLILLQINNITTQDRCTNCLLDFGETFREGDIVIIKKVINNIDGSQILDYYENLDLSVVKIIDKKLFLRNIGCSNVEFYKVDLTAQMTSSMVSAQEQMGLRISQSYEPDEDTSIAILDTGININHSMFEKNQLLHWKDFIGKDENGGNLYYEPCDTFGHGTAVCSIIAGNSISNGVYCFNTTVHRNTLRFLGYIEKEDVREIKISVEWKNGNQISVGLYNLDTEQIIAESPTFNNGSFTWKTLMFFGNNIIAFVSNKAGELTTSVTGTIDYPKLQSIKGVVPGAKLIVLKVLDDQGYGNTTVLLEALDYLLEIKDIYNIKIVNLSLGFDERLAVIDDAIRIIAENGIFPVIAAGNTGTSGEVESPGSSPYALTVGAVNSLQEIAYYSAHGCYCPFRDIKPDIVVPGGSLGVVYQGIKVADTNELNSLCQVQGTSFSTALMSGIVYSYIIKENWNYTWSEIKEIKYKILQQTFPAFPNYYNGDYDNIAQIPEDGVTQKDRVEGWGVFGEGWEKKVLINETSESFQQNATLALLSDPLSKLYQRTYFTKVITPNNKTISYSIQVQTTNIENNDNRYELITKLSKSHDQYGNPVFLSNSNTNEYILEPSSTYFLTVSLEVNGSSLDIYNKNTLRNILCNISISYISSYNLSLDIGFSNNIPYFNTKTVKLHLSYDIGRIVNISLDNVQLNINEVMETEQICSIDNVQEGEHYILFTIKAENEEYSKGVKIYVDLSKPQIFTDFTNNTIISNSIHIYFSSYDYSTVNFSIYIDQQKYFSVMLEPVFNSFTLMLNISNIPKGNHNLSIISYDMFDRECLVQFVFNIEPTDTTDTTETISTIETSEDVNTTETVTEGIITTQDLKFSVSAFIMILGVIILSLGRKSMLKHKKTNRGKANE